jgi:adenosylcobinamide-phosphate synthase
MWGYKTDRFLYFGWFSAKVDDWLGWPSSKLSTLLYTLAGSSKWTDIITALQNARVQGRLYKSLNGGWVMAAGASVLKIKLGGLSVYNNQAKHSVTLGYGDKVQTSDIKRSVVLVDKASWLFILIILILTFLLKGNEFWH